MKNLILLSLLFIASMAGAQTTKPIDGFLGIKFGSSQAQVIEALKTKGGALDKEASKPDMLIFDDVTLGGRKASAFFVYFTKDQAYQCVFVFRPELEAQTLDYFNGLAKDIADAYGNSQATKTFKEPYKEGDGYETTALKTGNAHYEMTWRDGDNLIWEFIEPNKDNQLRVRLIYRDGKLNNKVLDQQKEKNKSEF